MPVVNGLSSNGSLRINTRSTQTRTSSNQTFQEQFRLGLKNGIDLTNNAFQKVATPIVGSAALSATLSDAARSLTGKVGGLESSSSPLASNPGDGDIKSLEAEMQLHNQEMLEEQMRISQITTSYSTRSYILKAMFDAL